MTDDQADYLAVLEEYGLSLGLVRLISENSGDQIPMPPGSYRFVVGTSQIEGTGLLATKEILPREFIGPARIDGMRTPIGRFTNHSANPNGVMELLPNGDVNLVAFSTIHAGEEITVDYRQVLELARNSA